MSNIVYVGVSLDGFIAGKDGGLDWLQSIPNPDKLDFGFSDFMNRVDAVIMGRKTFDTVCGFEGDWVYSKPVFVLSNTLISIPEKFKGKAELIKENLSDIEKMLSGKGYKNLYIDGGVTIQNFLKEDRIDELIITTIPILLGGGTPLFRNLPNPLEYELVKSEVLLNAMVKNHYRRK